MRRDVEQQHVGGWQMALNKEVRPGGAAMKKCPPQKKIPTPPNLFNHTGTRQIGMWWLDIANHHRRGGGRIRWLSYMSPKRKKDA